MTRAPAFGAVAGNEMRYLTEASLYVVLGLGLAFLPCARRRAEQAARDTPAPAPGHPGRRGRPDGDRRRGQPGLDLHLRTHLAHRQPRPLLPGDRGAGGPRHGPSRAGRHPRSGRGDVTGPGAVQHRRRARAHPRHRRGLPPVSTDLHVLSDQGLPLPAQHRPVDDVGAWRGRGVWLADRRQRTHHPPEEAHPRLRLVAAHRLPRLTAERHHRDRRGREPHDHHQPGHRQPVPQRPGELDEVRISGLAAGTTLCIDVIEVATPEPGESS